MNRVSRWRLVADRVCRETLRELPEGATLRQARVALREAYPFGHRSQWPYKIWLQVQKAHLEMRFPDLAEARRTAQNEELKRRIAAMYGEENG